jgi:hypothetical protein
MEACCGTTCDKSLLENEFKVLGAHGFAEFLIDKFEGDTEAEISLQEALQEYADKVNSL